MYIYTYIYVYVCSRVLRSPIYMYTYAYICAYVYVCCIGLQVCLLKSIGFFAEYSLFYRALLQKRPKFRTYIAYIYVHMCICTCMLHWASYMSIHTYIYVNQNQKTQSRSMLSRNLYRYSSKVCIYTFVNTFIYKCA